MLKSFIIPIILNKRVFLVLFISLMYCFSYLNAQNVAVTDDSEYSADASAMLDIKSTSKGLLAPRMTEAQRTAISSPATSLLVYQTDGTAGYYYYTGSAWTQIGAASGTSQWTTTGSDIYYNTGNVGIGTTSPTSLLQVGDTETSQINPGIGTYGHVAIRASQQLLSFGLSGADPYSSWIQSSNPVNTNSLPLVLNPSGGNVGIGTTNPGHTLTVSGTAWVTSGSWVGSDSRWKKNATPLSGSLDKVMQLKGVNFDWKKDEYPEMNFNDGLQIGFIAQDVEKIIPEIVTTNKDGYKGLDYAKLTPVLVDAIQEQQKEIDELKAELQAIKSMLQQTAGK